MASSITEYNICKKYRHDGTLDLDSNTIMAALINPSYIPDYVNDTIFSDVSLFELPTGNGYTQGGVALNNKVVDTVKFNASDIIFTGLGTPSPVTFRYICLYALGTLNGIPNPLIALILADTLADITVTASDYNLIWDNSGIATL